MMNKIFCRSFKSPWAILYFASVIIMFYYYKGYNIPIEVWIMNTHYIPVYLNTAFIIFSIRKARDYESVHVQSIIRLGRLKYVTELIKAGIYNVIFYYLSSIALQVPHWSERYAKYSLLLIAHSMKVANKWLAS